MTIPRLTAVRLSPGRKEPRPLLVLGPSLGTSTRLWRDCAALLAGEHDIIAWDLPGHGASSPATEAFTMAELAAAVLEVVDRAQAERGDRGAWFRYAGDSVGGAVGLQLLLDAPGRVAGAAVVCSGAKIAEPATWHERAATVRAGGTSVLVPGSQDRWFAGGFLERAPAVGSALLDDLRAADRYSYAWACEALAGFDVRARLGEIAAPVLAISGDEDGVAPPDSGEEVARGVQHGFGVTLDGVGHLAPAEVPDRVAQLLRTFFARLTTLGEVHDAGMAVRRAVLGDAHVDRAVAAADETTHDFQELITRYAWGGIWSRPGLDRRSRSMVTLTALVAHGHWEELALHVRAALRNELTRAEVTEVLLQSAVYCGVPAANSAFRVAQEVFRSLDESR